MKPGARRFLLSYDTNFSESRCKTSKSNGKKKVIGSHAKHFPSMSHSSWSGVLALLCHRSTGFPPDTEQLGLQRIQHGPLARAHFIRHKLVSGHKPLIFQNNLRMAWQFVFR